MADTNQERGKQNFLGVEIESATSTWELAECIRRGHVPIGAAAAQVPGEVQAPRPGTVAADAYARYAYKNQRKLERKLVFMGPLDMATVFAGAAAVGYLPMPRRKTLANHDVSRLASVADRYAGRPFADYQAQLLSNEQYGATLWRWMDAQTRSVLTDGPLAWLQALQRLRALTLQTSMASGNPLSNAKATLDKYERRRAAEAKAVKPELECKERGIAVLFTDLPHVDLWLGQVGLVIVVCDSSRRMHVVVDALAGDSVDDSLGITREAGWVIYGHSAAMYRLADGEEALDAARRFVQRAAG